MTVRIMTGKTEEMTMIMKIKKSILAITTVLILGLCSARGEALANGAEAELKKRVSAHPRDYVAMTMLGKMRWNGGDKRGAARLFKKAVEIAPDYPDAHFYLGRDLFFGRRHEEAAGEFRLFKEKMDELSEIDEEKLDFYIWALHRICSMYGSLKRYDLAGRECKKVIALDPDDQTAHFNLAVCYYRHYRNRSRAYKELKKVIDIDYATKIADRAKYFIDYIRRNPDPHFAPDFSFINE